MNDSIRTRPHAIAATDSQEHLIGKRSRRPARLLRVDRRESSRPDCRSRLPRNDSRLRHANTLGRIGIRTLARACFCSATSLRLRTTSCGHRVLGDRLAAHGQFCRLRRRPNASPRSDLPA